MEVIQTLGSEVADIKYCYMCDKENINSPSSLVK